MYTKKAAMFGLDARIALAIFGALSVIMGAQLYSAIENAMATSLLTEMQEIGKAWQQYYLDTGTNLPRVELTDTSSNDFYVYKSGYLINDHNIVGWNGPYLGYKASGDEKTLKHPVYKYSALHVLTKELAFGGGTQTWVPGKCVSGYQCQVWIMMAGIPSDNLAFQIDNKVDGGDGPDAGNFRWWEGLDEFVWRYHLKFADVANPNDL